MIVAAGVMECMAGAAGGLYLEFAGRRRGGESLALPVKVKELSAGGVVLKVEETAGKVDLAHLQGQEAFIRLPGIEDGELGRIQTRVLWAKAPGDKTGECAIGLELADPDLRIRKMLEDRLQGYPRDIKELWDQWDRVHVRPFPLKADHAVYLAGC